MALHESRLSRRECEVSFKLQQLSFQQRSNKRAGKNCSRVLVEFGSTYMPNSCSALYAFIASASFCSLNSGPFG